MRKGVSTCAWPGRSSTASIPLPIRDAARNGFGARAVVYGLLLDGNSAIRSKQLVVLEKDPDREARRELARLLPARLPPWLTIQSSEAEVQQ